MDDYPSDYPAQDPTNLPTGYADACKMKNNVTVFKRSRLEPFDGQKILEPTGETHILTMEKEVNITENFQRSDGNDRVLTNKAYMFILDGNRRPQVVLKCNFGCVARAELILKKGERWETSGVKVAIKQLRLGEIEFALRSGKQNNPFQEVAVMQYLQRYYIQTNKTQNISQEFDEAMKTIRRSQYSTLDSHILMPFDIFKDDMYLFIILPFLDGGDLYDRTANRRITEDEARHFLSETIKGMEFLQRAGICHRDLSIENLLTDRTNNTVVFDFGMSFKIPYRDEDSRLFQYHNHDYRWQKRCLVKGQGHCGKVSFFVYFILIFAKLFKMTFYLFKTLLKEPLHGT